MAQIGSLRDAGVQLKKQDTEIQREDQVKICHFSRLNMKAQDLKYQIKKLKEEIDNLEDASFLIEESFGEGLKLHVGECFVTCEEDQATSYVEKLQGEKQDDLEAKQDELDDCENEMKNLKSYLYARFGSSINLEEGE
mmetsp:Transcript_24336/g.33196  ORF Transcript_24336/g.33196 Transcript_24336/m.33196 type:complete len:138 (-) Transcript_24336:89-502(-)|eukprot:CAMPEP_0176379716 /NCGR_PEP_ID=MMETSP0126-20121128/30564_1 /TAXON_ID=141414 ORGANISM="Strombidinopsis acuminatum, Strain SPMC142" /NCGR_SAMPLE_ID=MMETSP0126 /ASSEMBLY_ACC=CAM_ASM_000229 /LENGTH=137 /DNA_ID=CAMNT_0017742627 /DNA_START=26 /DNA_END=439 /DNA_ORIENTATION=+